MVVGYSGTTYGASLPPKLKFWCPTDVTVRCEPVALSRNVMEPVWPCAYVPSKMYGVTLHPTVLPQNAQLVMV